MSKSRQKKRDNTNDEAQRWRQVSELGLQLLRPIPGPVHVHHSLAAQRDLIVGAAARLLNAEAQLWLMNDLFLLATQEENGPPPAKPAEPKTELMRCALHSQRNCCARSSADPDPSPDGDWQSNQSGDPKALAAPLIAEDPESHQPVVLGVLQLERESPDGFSPEDIAIIEGISAQAALALQSVRQMALEDWRINQLSLVRKVSAQISNVRDLDTLAQQVTQLIRDTFDYYFVAIFTIEPGTDILHFRSSAGPGGQHKSIPSQESSTGEEGWASYDSPSPVLTIHVGQGMIGLAASQGEEILANDVNQEPRYRFTDALPETHSEVALPLKIEERVLGVLDVQSNQANAFHETDMLVLRALAGNIASAVESARLYTALLRRAEQLSTVYEVSNAITSILDLDSLLKEVADLVQQKFGYPYVHVFSVHPGRRKVFYEAGSGPRSHIFKQQRYAHDLDAPDGIIPWVARNGTPIVANDVDSEPRYQPSQLPPENTRSELAVPLIFGGEVLGVLDVQSDRLNAFGEEDRFLFEALADNIAIAMRNASLYRSELWRRQVADSIREVAGLLSADADLNHVLDAILAELSLTLPCDVAAIWLLNEVTGEEAAAEEPDENWRPELYLAAVLGVEAAELGHELSIPVRRRSEEVEEEAPASWLGEVLYASEPQIRAPEAPFEPIGAALGFPPGYSAIAAPLKIGEQRMGVLVLAHQTSGRYGSEASSMTATFASYAAVAIENTRLYEAAHEQAWVSTVLLQVGDATQAITNLHELLATVVRITPMLVGVRACAVYLLDDSDSFIPAASYGFNEEQQAEFERWRVAPGESQAFENLFEEKRPQVMYGAEIDEMLASILHAGEDDQPENILETLVIVPLLQRGEIIGAMVVDYSEERLAAGAQVNGGPADLEALFDERLSIIQGVAHQTATAVENIRLLKSQREEAYVSVALLQVAQAVVSANDLDEALGAIVRITPILVGVKRSLIYLWDDEEDVFYLSQAYGMPRDAGQEVYAPEDFPLLDAVRKWDTIMAFPLEGTPEDMPEMWAHFPVPDLDIVDDLLESSNCLLLAFPLSMRGKVMGVLLVEEPPPTAVEPLDGSGGWRRLREKRIEITTGISQQAAMAIQNDQLQREMVERERLEREFQLAREIQITFLPHEVPDLPGWDLGMRWRTAREVGGDFYDYFLLPDGRLAMVIADVADKGMPAALFMILVRTLLRATVQSERTPAQVLSHINDVLVPDAEGGMFVTLLYAVVDLGSGEVEYANAGHNPPFLVRTREQELVAMERSGMALGVVAGTEFEDRHIHMRPGDFITFYTDGLTDAFSQAGDMFGEDRVRSAILSAVQGGQGTPSVDPDFVLDSIERAMTEFVQDAPRFDDLTLMVLKREK